MELSRTLKHGISGIVIALACGSQASASFLDSDFWCRTYGCAVVHDGQVYDIYDNYQFATQSCCVPVGGQMRSYYSNRFGGFNLTGSLNNHQGPNGNQSMLMGITQNGTTISQTLMDDGDGFLDAADSFNVFSLNPNTDIRLAGVGRQYSHSFFITSRNTRFSLRALASIANSTQDFSNTITLGDIKIDTSVSRQGQDGNFRYGRRASSSNITILNGIDDLGDMQSAPTRVIDFGRFSGIRRRNGNINDQTIRLDFNYTMPDYDMSMGVGTMNIDMVFDFYREP